MRVRTVTYFLNHINSNNSKNSGPKNPDEILNQEIGEYFAEKKETKKVA